MIFDGVIIEQRQLAYIVIQGIPVVRDHLYCPLDFGGRRQRAIPLMEDGAQFLFDLREKGIDRIRFGVAQDQTDRPTPILNVPAFIIGPASADSQERCQLVEFIIPSIDIVGVVDKVEQHQAQVMSQPFGAEGFTLKMRQELITWMDLSMTIPDQWRLKSV